MHASYLEIYNEDIRDLLGKDIKKRLELKEHNDSGVYVAGLSMHPVNDVRSCEQLMEQGWKNRSVGATLMNADSSRSHSIFTIYVERMGDYRDENNNIRKVGPRTKHERRFVFSSNLLTLLVVVRAINFY